MCTRRPNGLRPLVWCCLLAVLVQVACTQYVSRVYEYSDNSTCTNLTRVTEQVTLNNSVCVRTSPATNKSLVITYVQFEAAANVAQYSVPDCSSEGEENLESVNMVFNDSTPCFGTFRVTIFRAPCRCINLYSDWTAWTSTCGNASRTRSVTDTIEFQGNNSPAPCIPCDPVDTKQTRVKSCVDPTQVTVNDFCHYETRTCHVSSANAGGYNSPFSFLTTDAGSPFADGWTLMIDPLPNDNSFIISQAIVSYNNIVIRSSVLLETASISASTTPYGVPAASFGISVGACTPLVFLGNNITLINLRIIVPPECSNISTVYNGVVLENAAIYFAGVNLALLNTILVGAVAGVYVHRSVPLSNILVLRNVTTEVPVQPTPFAAMPCWLMHVYSANDTAIEVSSDAFVPPDRCMVTFGGLNAPIRLPASDNCTDVDVVFLCTSHLYSASAPVPPHIKILKKHKENLIDIVFIATLGVVIIWFTAHACKPDKDV